jgi:hypothetical protein
MAVTGPSARDIAEVAASLRNLRDEVVAIATEDDARLNRIEAEARHTRLMVDALCRAIGGPARKALEQLEAEEARDG